MISYIPLLCRAYIITGLPSLYHAYIIAGLSVIYKVIHRQRIVLYTLGLFFKFTVIILILIFKNITYYITNTLKMFLYHRSYLNTCNKYLSILLRKLLHGVNPIGYLDYKKFYYYKFILSYAKFRTGIKVQICLHELYSGIPHVFLYILHYFKKHLSLHNGANISAIFISNMIYTPKVKMLAFTRFTTLSDIDNIVSNAHNMLNRININEYYKDHYTLTHLEFTGYFSNIPTPTDRLMIPQDTYFHVRKVNSIKNNKDNNAIIPLEEILAQGLLDKQFKDADYAISTEDFIY